MNKTLISQALGDINPRFVTEASDPADTGKEILMKKHPLRPWLMGGIAAACVALGLFAGTVLLHRSPSSGLSGDTTPEIVTSGDVVSTNYVISMSGPTIVSTEPLELDTQIWYVSEGVVRRDTLLVKQSADHVFAAWREKNGLSDSLTMTLTTTVDSDTIMDSSVATHTVHKIHWDLTLSGMDLEDTEETRLLMESLQKTMLALNDNDLYRVCIRYPLKGGVDALLLDSRDSVEEWEARNGVTLNDSVICWQNDPLR